MAKICGIYCIRCIVTNKRYIGQAGDILNRWEIHKRNLRIGKHHSYHLQNAWSKYGSDKFRLSVIEECNKEMLDNREQYWMDHYGASNPEFGYNICNKARSSRGVKRRLEIIEKIREKSVVWKYAKKGSMKGVPKSVVLRKLSGGNPSNILSTLKLKAINKRYKGEGNPNSKLNEQIVWDILCEYEYGSVTKSIRALSQKYNMRSSETIRNIVTGKSWKQVYKKWIGVGRPKLS